MQSLWHFTLDSCLKLTVGFALLDESKRFSVLWNRPCDFITTATLTKPKLPSSVVKWWSAECIKTCPDCNFLYRVIRIIGSVTLSTVEARGCLQPTYSPCVWCHLCAWQGAEWSWGNQIWSLLKEKVNHCGKPPSHCLSPFRGSGFILSSSLPTASSETQRT